MREDNSQATLPIPTVYEVEDKLPEGIIYGNEGQIWKVEFDGSVNALAEWPVEEFIYGKDLSSDGRNFVYATLAGDTRDIFHVDLHSGEVHNLTQTPSRVEYCPVWWSNETPGILFTYLKESGFPGSWCADDYAIVNIDGQYTEVDWDTDQLEVMLPEGGEPRVIMRNLKAWLYRSDGSLSVIRPDIFGLDVGKVFMASLSPDGDRVAMVISTPSADQVEIQNVILDLPTVTSQILESYEACECAPFWNPPAWSPDGRWVLFDGDERFILYRTDGLDQVNVNGDGNPVWSPDSRYFAYNKDQQIFILDTTNWKVANYSDMEGAVLLGWVVD
jgi:Tol biopolymer transport system component